MMYFPKYPSIPLKYGDRGSSVETMQSALNVVFDKYPVHELLKINGIFDDKTDAAVRRLQQHVGLNENGVVDIYTWVSIFALAHTIYEA